MMNLEDIKGLMQEFDRSSIHKMTLKLESVTLKLEKESAQKELVMAPSPSSLAAPTAPLLPTPVVSASTEASEVAAEPVGTPVKSPVVGTFYRASSPEAAPFVTVGQRVQKGQTLCIIEAMKMMNEITAPVAGEIISILVNQEDMIEYDQTIMLIKED
ncbi:MAG: acetyl-CoA carboxylase biotin carboxyl carrier protein [Clostridiales bacterium]|jgi:acetyl-CoA carboxylase biotin carboxyl carrier protein|nr:acetyl-CoA carboxylase biotin carboxyl carrier protein [Clostridiales bacterium]